MPSTRVVALTTVGLELPELISDGYLVYLLHVAKAGSPLLRAAVRCCSGRRSTILLPLLFDKLGEDPSLRESVVSALCTYEERAVLERARVALLETVRRVESEEEEEGGSESLIVGCALWMAKAVSLRAECLEVVVEVLRVAVEVGRERWSRSTEVEDGGDGGDGGGVADHVGVLESCRRAHFISFLEPLIDFWRSASPEPSALSSLQNRIIQSSSKRGSEEEVVLSLLSLVIVSIESNARHLGSTGGGGTTTTTLQLVRLGALLRGSVRLLLQVCGIRFFPHSLSVNLLFDGLLSNNDEHRAAANEVLENLLSSKYRELVLPTLTRWYEADSELLRDVGGGAAGAAGPTRGGELPPLEILRVLMHTPLFETVALEDVHRVMEYEGAITQRKVERGTVFARAGERETEIFIVATGTVSVFVPGSGTTEREKEDEVATLGRGSCIGERRLSALFFTDTSRSQLERETSAVAVTDCCLVLVSLQKLASMVQASPTILRGVLSVLLLDLRRCYVHRMNTQHKLRMTAAAAGGGGGGKTAGGKKVPATTTAAVAVPAAADLQQTLSKWSIPAAGAVVTKRVRSAGTPTARLSLLELCICLKDVKAFRHLSNDTITLLAESGDQSFYASGESMFVEGDPSSFLVIVIEGSCHLYSSRSGEEHVIGRVGKGYLVGEQSLVPSSPRLVTCTVASQSARGEALVLKFDSAMLLRLMAKERSLSEAVAEYVLERLDKESERRGSGDVSLGEVHAVSGGGGGGGGGGRGTRSGSLWRKIRRSVVLTASTMSEGGDGTVEKGEEKGEEQSGGLRRRHAAS